MAQAFTEHTVAQRKKQIDIGKATEGYKNYLEAARSRNPRHADPPRTPDPYAPDSNRQFDGRLRVWRQKLREYEQKSAARDDENDIIEIKGPVTLVVRNAQDELEALEIQRNNPPGSVSILNEIPASPAKSESSDDEWLHFHLTSGAQKLYF